MSEVDIVGRLRACPFCSTTEHLRLQATGSLTGDMPDRPYRVVCRHIDCEEVSGPVAYGRMAAAEAWNRRPARTAAEAELARCLEALEAYEDALDEAEAIFGGEYGDHYGPMCEKAFEARDKRRAALEPKP